MSRPRVAIVGAGIAGIGAALELQDDHDVVLFDGAPEIGGHILPVKVDGPSGEPAWVDTGFVIFVAHIYPRVCALLERLGVAHEPAATEFRITDDPRGLSFAPGELLRMCGKQLPKRCRGELLRVHQALQQLRKDGMSSIDNVSMAEWIERQGFCRETAELGVLPWVASFWGLQPETVLRVAAPVALREISRNAGPHPMHHVVPSTRAYLDALIAALAPTQIRRARVDRVTLDERPRVAINGHEEAFDQVVLAVGADDARRLLQDPPPRLAACLEVFRYEPTAAVLHHDAGLLPTDRADWRTFHHRRREDSDRHRSMTTWVLDLLHAWTGDPTTIARPTLLSTGDPGLLGNAIIDPALVHTRFEHRHLVMTPEVVEAVAELAPASEGLPVILAGSYCCVGALHEEALLSGEQAAARVRANIN